MIYPIKSLGGISLETAEVTPRGLRYDRWWMLVDSHGLFLTQRTHPVLALFRTVIKGSVLSVYHAHHPHDVLRLALHPSPGKERQVRIWEDTCTAHEVSETASLWFSKQLGQEVQLVYMPESTQRLVDPSYAKQGEITSFSDGYPILIIGQESLNDLNRRLVQPVPMDRFRPNLVFSGGDPYQEDIFKYIRIGDVACSVVKSCARCVVTTIDQSTAVLGKEPLQTLAGFRTKDHRILFGQNVLVHTTGTLALGYTIYSSNEPLQ